jgi:hypothetical protein
VTTVTSQHSTFNQSRRVSLASLSSGLNKNHQAQLKTPAGNVLGSNKNKNLLASMNNSSINNVSLINESSSKQKISKTADMATSPIKVEFLGISTCSSMNVTKPFSDKSNYSLVNCSNSSSNFQQQSLGRVSPNQNENKFDYTRMSQFSDSKINISSSRRREDDDKQDKNWNNLVELTNTSEYIESDTEYLNPVHNKLHGLMSRTNLEMSNKRQNMDLSLPVY